MAHVLFGLVLAVVLAWSEGQGSPDDGGGDNDCTLIMQSGIEECGERQEFVDIAGLDMVRHNMTFAYLEGQLLFLQEWGEDGFMHMTMEKETSGRALMMYTYDLCDVCSEIGDPEAEHAKYLRSYGFPEKCPFPAGTYKVDKMEADVKDLPITDCANQGRYIAKVTLYKDMVAGKHCDPSMADSLACLSLKFSIDRKET